MDDNSQLQTIDQKKSPTDLLTSQTQSLSELVKIQQMKSAYIEDLKRQNEKVISLLSKQQIGSSAESLSHVKIENVNMPFGELIGFMLKVALASIPAAIILSILYVIVIAVFGGILSGLL